MSEKEWYFEYNYGELMEPFENVGMVKLDVDEITFRQLLVDFLKAISQDNGGKRK